MKKSTKKFKILAGVLGIVLGVSAIFAPACSVKGVDDTYVNDKGELVIVYTDGTEKNLGVVKGEDGKDGANGLDGKDGIDGIDGTDGVDGEDLTLCAHEYGDWQTQISATCTSIGYDTRTCTLCGDIDYQFNKSGYHNYDLQNAISVIDTCGGNWVNATCKNCGDTELVQTETTIPHTFVGCTCTECGYEKAHSFDYEQDVEVITNTCSERIINIICQDCNETYTFTEQPNINHVYEDGVCTECGYLLNCDSCSLFSYCEECKNCWHYFITDYEKALFIDETRHWGTSECRNCGEVRLFRTSSHYFDYENAVDIVSTCTERWVNATCIDCNNTCLIENYVKHHYDENGVCAECRDITHFIESEEYIEYHSEDGSSVTWWSIDRSYGLILVQYRNINNCTPGYVISGYVGTPTEVIIPAGQKEVPIGSIVVDYGFYVLNPFENCETLEIIIYPDNMDISPYYLDGCTNLKLSCTKSEVPEEYMYLINSNYKENE